MSGKPATAALGLLGSPKAISELVKVLANELPKQVDRGFVRAATPEGNPWARRKDDRTHPLLQLTRVMRKTILAVVLGRQVHMRSPTKYLRFHQQGTVKMPARRLAPIAEMPQPWIRALNTRMVDRLKELQRGQ